MMLFSRHRGFFEAVDILTIHAKQIPVLSYLKSLTCFFSVVECAAEVFIFTVCLALELQGKRAEFYLQQSGDTAVNFCKS